MANVKLAVAPVGCWPETMGKPRPGLPPVPHRKSLSPEPSGQEGRRIRRDEAANHLGEARLLRPGAW